MRKQDPLLSAPFSEQFDKPNWESRWRALSSAWQVRGGKLCVSDAYNQGIWLARRLPTNLRIEFRAEAASSQGDIKWELFGDGRSSAKGTSYTDATSYVMIFGGWKNRFHVLAKGNEHGAGRLQSRLASGEKSWRKRPVKAGQVYKMRLERGDGRTLRWWVDGKQLFELPDATPLVGLGHDHFGFNNWRAGVCFDDLRIRSLGARGKASNDGKLHSRYGDKCLITRD